MAHIIGISGAWKEILKTLRPLGLEVGHPRELRDLLAQAKRDYNHCLDDARKQIDSELEQSRREVASQRALVNLDLAG